MTKSARAAQKPYGHRERKMFQNAVSAVGMKFSDRHNAIYDETDAAALLATMSKERMCAEQAAEILRDSAGRSPGADWLLGKLGQVDYETMHKRADKILRRTVTDSIKGGLIGKSPIIAIDKTKIPRYDHNPDMTHKIKYRGPGTRTAEAYITARTVGQKHQTHLACLPVTRDAFNPEFVRKLLQTIKRMHIRPQMVLMDKEFYSVDVLNTINNAGLRFMTPAVCTKGVERAIQEHIDGHRDAVSKYTISSGSSKIRCNLIILEREDKNKKKFHIAFVTNMTNCTPEDLFELPEEYRKRWGIETGYRDVKRAMPRTCSRNDAIRLILFYLSLGMSNIWMIARSWCKKKKIKLKVLLARIIRWCMRPWNKKPPDPG